MRFDPKLIPLTVPPEAAVRLIRLEVFVPLEGEAEADSLMVNPLMVFPAPVLLFLKDKLARLVLLVDRLLSVTSKISPAVAVDVIDSVPVIEAVPEV